MENTVLWFREIKSVEYFFLRMYNKRKPDIMHRQKETARANFSS